VVDIIVLCLNPPDEALVLSVDEKSQIQVLERTQPILPLGRVVRSTMLNRWLSLRFQKTISSQRLKVRESQGKKQLEWEKAIMLRKIRL